MIKSWTSIYRIITSYPIYHNTYSQHPLADVILLIDWFYIYITNNRLTDNGSILYTSSPSTPNSLLWYLQRCGLCYLQTNRPACRYSPSDYDHRISCRDSPEILLYIQRCLDFPNARESMSKDEWTAERGRELSEWKKGGIERPEFIILRDEQSDNGED